MAQLWPNIERATHEGRLGYFSNFSDDSQTMIVYHPNALNNSEKNRVSKRINQIKRGLDVSVVYRTEDDPTFRPIDERQAPYVEDSEEEQETQLIDGSVSEEEDNDSFVVDNDTSENRGRVR